MNVGAVKGAWNVWKILGAWLVLQSLLAGCVLPHDVWIPFDVQWLEPDSCTLANGDGAAVDAGTDAIYRDDSAVPPLDTVTCDVAAEGSPDSAIAEISTNLETSAVDTAGADVVDVLESGSDAAADLIDAPDTWSPCGELLWNSYHCGNCALRCDDIQGSSGLCQAGLCISNPETCGEGDGAACRSCATDDDCTGLSSPGLTYNGANGANAHPHCCGGRCAPPGDPANCGTCGHACQAAEQCGWQSVFDDDVSCF